MLYFYIEFSADSNLDRFELAKIRAREARDEALSVEMKTQKWSEVISGHFVFYYLNDIFIWFRTTFL